MTDTINLVKFHGSGWYRPIWEPAVAILLNGNVKLPSKDDYIYTVMLISNLAREAFLLWTSVQRLING